jgi:hypothetical protein
MQQNWFAITITQGEGTYRYVGSSPHTLEQIATFARQGEYIVLNDLRYYDRSDAEKVSFKSWSEWDKSIIPSVAINPTSIITILQYKNDPITK